MNNDFKVKGIEGKIIKNNVPNKDNRKDLNNQNKSQNFYNILREKLTKDQEETNNDLVKRR